MSGFDSVRLPTEAQGLLFRVSDYRRKHSVLFLECLITDRGLFSESVRSLTKTHYLGIRVSGYRHRPRLFSEGTWPEVIKLFSCSTQLSLKFKMIISIKILRNLAYFRLR